MGTGTLLKGLKFWQRQLDDLEGLPDEVDGIDFWTQPMKKFPTDVLVSPDSIEEVKEYLRDKTIDYEILIKDLQVRQAN